MKLIAQRRFQHEDKDVEIGQIIDVSDATGKELLAVGNLVITDKDHAASQADKAEDASRVNINGGVDAHQGAIPATEVNPPIRTNKPGADRKKKPAPGPAETK